VQTVLIGTGGLLENKSIPVSNEITQSMCRQTTSKQQEESICTACKSPCKDIDSEDAYWQELDHPGRKLIQYGYIGLVIGFFSYQFLYAGNFDYYYSGFWHHEPNQSLKILQPGFYISNYAVPIPKLIAAPLTLAIFTWLTYYIGRKLEKIYLKYARSTNKSRGKKQIQHQAFAISAFLAFNLFFIYAGRGEVLRFPFTFQLGFQGIILLVSTLWLSQNWHRTFQEYERQQETRNSHFIGKQLPYSFAGAKGNLPIPNQEFNQQHTVPRATRIKILQSHTKGNTRIRTTLRVQPNNLDPNRTILSLKPKNIDPGHTIPRINPDKFNQDDASNS
jgi:hypothetical protein